MSEPTEPSGLFVLPSLALFGEVWLDPREVVAVFYSEAYGEAWCQVYLRSGDHLSVNMRPPGESGYVDGVAAFVARLQEVMTPPLQNVHPHAEEPSL